MTKHWLVTFVHGDRYTVHGDTREEAIEEATRLYPSKGRPLEVYEN